jgi:type I restriction enzyme S subunit
VTTTLRTGWAEAPLAALLREHLRNGHSAKASGSGEGIPTLTLTAVTTGQFTADNVKLTVASREKVQDLWLEPGDIFVERSNTPELVGTAALFTGPRGFAVFPDLLIRVRLRNEVNTQYVAAFLRSPRARAYFRARAQGIAGSMPKIDQGAVEGLAIPIAPRSEQDRIVAAIEQHLSDIDAGVAALERVRTNLKRYGASVLKTACEGRLVPTEAELARRERRTYEPANVLLERILKERRVRWEREQLAKMQAKGEKPRDDRWKAKYVEPAPPTVADLPELPRGWCWTALGQLVWSVKDGPHYSPTYTDAPDGVPFITGGNVRPSGVDFDSAKRISPALHVELCKRVRPEVGDLLYTKGGTTGIARVNTYARDFSVWVHVAVLKLAGHVEPFYLQHALNSPFCYAQAQRQTHGVGNQDLGLTRMIGISVPLPPLMEQRRIIAEVDRQLSIADETEPAVVAQLARASRLRQAVLKTAFEGKLVPQDPSDEPASALVERLRASTPAQSGRERARPRRLGSGPDPTLEP